MRFRDKEKNLLVNLFTKTAEYVLSIIVLGAILSGEFHLWLFSLGIVAFVFLVIIAIYISSQTRDDKEVKKDE